MGVSVPVGVSLPAPGGRCSGPSGSPAQPGSGAELTPGIEPVSPDTGPGGGGSPSSGPPAPLRTTTAGLLDGF